MSASPPASPIPVAFRVAAAEDVLLISVCATHVFLDTYATQGLRPDLAREAASVYSVDAFRARLHEPATTLVLAERGEHLLGFAEFSRSRPCPCSVDGWDVQSDVELVRLYVLPIAQGMGLGRALLGHAEQMLLLEGAAGLWLTAWAGNARALAFYPAMGYRNIGTTDYIIEGQAYENKVFAKALRPGPVPRCR